MIEIKINRNNQHFKAYPETTDVFFQDVEKHRKFLFPLAQLDLSSISENLQGILPLVSPIEPYDGTLGYKKNEFYNDHCRENWIGYKIQDGKCKLLCDFQIFELEAFNLKTVKSAKEIKYFEVLQQFYQQAYKGYQILKEEYKQQGVLYCPYSSQKREERLFERKLGGNDEWYNWAQCEMPFHYEPYIDEEGEESNCVYPLIKGKKFEYIGSAFIRNFFKRQNGWNCIGEMIVFYEPTEQIMLTTFE